MWALIAGMAIASAAVAQTSTVSAVPRHYIATMAGLGNGQEYLAAASPRFDAPGRECLIMTGTVTSSTGTVPMVYTRQLDEDSRVDLGTPPTRSLVAANLTATPAVTAALSDNERRILETLYDDSMDAFLYSVQYKGGLRFLGRGFRTDDGTTPNYQGPYYDIWVRYAPVTVLPERPMRVKHFYFDSTTKLLAKSRYMVSQNGAETVVEVQYTGWHSSGGRMIPSQIVRQENGQAVLSVVVQDVEPGASAASGFFTVAGGN